LARAPRPPPPHPQPPARGPMHLLLIRHGQSQNNILEAALGAGEAFNGQRVVDPPLSELGEGQAELLGQRLAAQLRRSGVRVRLLCSSMTRAMQTIAPLARALRLSPLVLPDLHEVKGFYDASGRKVHGPGRAALRERFPDFDVSLVPEEGQSGESGREALERVRRVVGVLRKWGSTEGTQEDVVIIVSHNDFIGLLGRRLLVPSGQDPARTSDEPEELFTESYWPMNNTGINHLVVGVRPPGGAYQVDTYFLYWNRSDHLPEAMRAGIQFKNMGALGAGAWARVGAGGSGLSPAYEEREAVHVPARGKSSSRTTAEAPAWGTMAASAAFGAAVAAWLLLVSPRLRR